MESNNFELIIKRGCGIDVHEKSVVVTIRGDGIGVETRTFLTFTEDLGELLSWLKSKEVTHGAMESTGVYWKPVYNILSESLHLILVNARHMKNVPGRKTDKVDSAWICKLLMSGLLNASFIPQQQTRELRDMNRYGIKLTQDLASEKNRLHKILEDANIKLSSVVSDIDGVVASKLIAGLVEGKASIKELVEANYHKKMKASKADLEKALTGKVTAHHRFMLRQIYAHMAYLESQIMLIDNQIKEVLSADQALLTLLTEIPGVGLKSAIQIVSEVGTELSKFPTEKHFAKWAGMAPGNNESAGKKKVDASPMAINTSKRHFANAVGQPVEQKILITEPNTIV